jgi:malonyl-ACP decarboxylase
MPSKLVITGIGVISAVGQGKDKFARALLEGKSAFGVMKRPGRQRNSAHIGAEISEIVFPSSIARRTLRGASLSGQAALVALGEAWEDAKLSEVDPVRIGLVVGGSNIQQRELLQTQEEYRDRPAFLRPTYALSFMDSDLCGFCTAEFGIRGLGYTVGGASASGQMAIIQAAQAVRLGQVDVCVALGALMDLSYWECQAMRALGAMGSDRYADRPELACRPFDCEHDGFIYGECSGALVIESEESSARRGRRVYASLEGWGVAMDGNRNPNPNLKGEIEAIERALKASGLRPEQIDYINPHGTGSLAGDATELEAVRGCGLAGAYLNATKSITGHGLSAAGTVEAIATLLQMENKRLHPTRNLEQPIDEGFNWVRNKAVDHSIANALTLSMGFGGINTALCWQRPNG